MWICIFSGIVACKQAKTLVSEVINVYLAEVSNVRLHTVACYFSLFSKRCSFPYTKMMLMLRELIESHSLIALMYWLGKQWLMSPNNDETAVHGYSEIWILIIRSYASEDVL